MAERIPYHMFDRFLMSAKRFEEDWRKTNEKCYEYVDNIQWTPDEAGSITDRGQQPTVINLILPTLDMVCAVANERSCDIQVVGREGSDDNKATLMTALLKQVFDSTDFDYYHQLAFRNAAVCGRAWFEIKKYTDERGKDLIKVDSVPWENVYLDPFSRKPDASDARFIIKIKWVDRDVAKQLFPESADQIDSRFNEDYHGQEYEAQNHSQERGDAFYFDPKSNRVKICECYYTMPEKKEIEYLNETTGKKERKTINKQTVHYVIFSDEIILKGSAKDHSVNKDPLGLDIIPLVPMYCMRDRYGLPKGIVNSLLDIQDQINKLNSKFLWTLMTNRIIAESGAFQDADAAKEEFQKPDGLVLVTEGRINSIKVDEKYRDLSYMSQHLQFLLTILQRISGVNDSMLGIGGTNERSGVIQNARISQGAAMQTCILENMYFSKKRIAYIVLRMIGKFYTDYRIMRITAPNGLTDTYEFNKPQVEMVQGPPNADGTIPAPKPQITGILNKIEDTLYYDVILKKVAPFTSQRAQQLSIFAEVMKSNVIPAPVAAKMMLSLSDMPNKEDLLLELENFYAAQAQAQAQAPAQG